MKVVVVGAGLMGSQIGCEFALGGHDVWFVARDGAAVLERVERALRLVVEHDLAVPEAVAAARERVVIGEGFAGLNEETDLVVESVPERLELKVEVLARAAREAPNAVLASNTSSLSITALGEGCGGPERTVGMHYWNPPLLMPLVEVVRGERTGRAVVERVTALLRSLGKRPIVVERDVPGFVWNRMQLALLREAVWLVEQGVASPAAVDEVVRDGLARRWRWTGPFQTAALGGAETFERIAENLCPVVSKAERIDDLRRWLDESPASLERDREVRDRGLVADLQRERADSASAGDAGSGGERVGRR